jgi:hypothetical protein
MYVLLRGYPITLGASMSIYPPEEANPALLEFVLKKVKFPNFPLPIRMQMKGGGLYIEIDSKDRETGLHCLVQCYRPIPPWFRGPSDIEHMLYWIKDEVMGLIRHEVEEFMLFDGHRVFDPHKPKQVRPQMMPQQAIDALFGGLLQASRQRKAP